MRAPACSCRARRWASGSACEPPITETLHRWLIAQRQRVPEGSGTALAIDYSLKRWEALTRYLDDGDAPIDNNWVENQIRPWAIGRSNWLFAGALRGSQRAAAIMSLIQSARLNGHDPYAYMKDVLTRLPTQKNSQINAKARQASAVARTHRGHACPTPCTTTGNMPRHCAALVRDAALSVLRQGKRRDLACNGVGTIVA